MNSCFLPIFNRPFALSQIDSKIIRSFCRFYRSYMPNGLLQQLICIQSMRNIFITFIKLCVKWTLLYASKGKQPIQTFKRKCILSKSSRNVIMINCVVLSYPLKSTIIFQQPTKLSTI